MKNGADFFQRIVLDCVAEVVLVEEVLVPEPDQVLPLLVLAEFVDDENVILAPLVQRRDDVSNDE